MRDHCCSNMALHFYTFVPLMKDHLSCKTMFCGPVGRLVTGVTVYHICTMCILFNNHFNILTYVFKQQSIVSYISLGEVDVINCIY